MRETPALPSRYTTPELIAYGGMGEVYRATDETLGRTVAVKVLAERHARNGEFHARFVREARAAASLSGEPNVVVIHDVGETEDGLPFIVMEYLSGGTVADRLRAGRVPTEQALEWLEAAGRAIDRAHERGIVHRDVKPANLLIAEDGTIRVSDFGIARVTGTETLTAAGTVLGSFGYMAPEQARGETSTPASDRYGLACIAFELLTGRRPFARDNPTAEGMAHAMETPPSPQAIDSRLPAALDAVFARGLAKRPEDRPATCSRLVADLRDALGGAAAGTATTTTVAVASAAPVTAARVTRHASRPRKAVVALAVVGLLGSGAALASALTGDGGSTSTVVHTQTVEGEASTVVVTETLQGETVERTVTVGEDGGSSEPASGADGVALNDQGFELLQRGDPAAALPVLEAAVDSLRGSSSITEAYASYNLAVARFSLGRCDGVGDLLHRSEQVQGERKEIDRLRRQVEKRCEDD